jgi:hypothetical protein
MTKEKFFVGIKNPIVVRRLLLNSSKDVLDALKDYESFERLKETKVKHVIELKKILDEILVLNKKLKSHLPKSPGKMGYKKVVKKKGKATRPKKMKGVASKLDALEQELSNVESRLKSLE